MLCLVARYNEQTVRFPLPTTRSRVGSSTANEFVIPFPGVSRLHAMLEPAGEWLKLTDAGSKNGLFVDGNRVDEVALGSSVCVQIGRAQLSVEESSSSDVLLAGENRSVSKKADPESGPGTESRQDARLVRSPEAALRFIREAAHLGDRITAHRRTWLLQEARKLLAAQSIAVISRTDAGDAVILAVDGPVPDRALLGSARTKSTRDVAIRNELREGRRITVASRGNVVALAVWAGSARRLAWEDDLFAFVAEKLLRPHSPRADNEEHKPDPGALVLPDGMVVGESDSMRKLFGQIESTVSSGMDVLLLGETGTGKELFAQMIHASGPTARNRLVAINCAAIPSELLESELFGVQGRVATGVDPRPGLFAQADGGSILLDEIAELPEPLQAKLLRVLQEREVLAIGSSTPRKINVRVISASNRNLFTLVQEGRFRADLFYRLRKLQFHIPPLRERREDIPALVLEFIHRAADDHKKEIRGITHKALALLTQHDWPGNVRELESEVRRAVLVCPNGGSIQSQHLDTGQWQVAQVSRTAETTIIESVVPFTTDLANRLFPPTLQSRIDQVERSAIQDALAITGGNQSKAARLLKITRNGLALKLTRLGIGRK